MAEEEDPFGFLISLCQPIPTDVLKLLHCPLLRQSETSPSLDLGSDSEFEQTPLTYSQSEVSRIHMVSPPESESDEEEETPPIDRNTPLENDVFHTPPEHYNRRSSSSSQEFLSQREKPAVNAVICERIQSTACVDDDIQLEGDETLRLQGTQELDGSDGDMETHCSENVIDVNRIVRTVTNLKRYSVLVDESEESSKKIRVSKKNQTMINDQLDCTDASALDKGPMERIKEKNVDKEHRVKLCSKENLEFAPGNSVGGLKNTKNEDICVTNVISTSMDSEVTVGFSIDERLNKNAVEDHRVEPCSVDNLDSAPLKSFGRNKETMNDGVSVTNLDSMDKNCGISMHNEGLNNVKTCLMSTEDLSIKASNNVMAMENNGIKQKDCESSLGNKNTKEIESFRYEVCPSDRNYIAKEGVSRGKRELPLSIRGKENEPRNPKSKKRSWHELIDAYEVYFKMDESFEDVDFLETAKRRGLTFPQPKCL